MMVRMVDFRDSPLTHTHTQLAMQTLEELDWCLRKLESVNSSSMGTMAQDKFRRILSRELSHMSGKSRSGNHVAEWVQNITNPSKLASHTPSHTSSHTLSHP